MEFTRRNVLKGGVSSALLAAFGKCGQASDSPWTSQEKASSATVPRSVQPPAPPWMQSLVIYEIAPKGFTSPNGPESGTFASLQSRLPYLQDLGITGIWLAGYSLSDPHHFFNIWMSYATIEPNRIDPSLGTPKQFKALIAEAHSPGIKIFLDVTTHGVMPDSPIVKRHPEWFRSGAFGMIDYDWNGGHTDLDDWWVKIYTDFVTVYGVDGYRLDSGIYRPDLWERIRQNSAAAGHSIVIFEESAPVIPGVTDFTEQDNNISNILTGELNPVLVSDVPGFYDRKFGKHGEYKVEIRYEDDSKNEGSTGGEGTLRVRLDGLIADTTIIENMEAPGIRYVRITVKNVTKTDDIPYVRLTVKNVASRPIQNVTVSNDCGEIWVLRDANHLVTMDGQAPVIQLYIRTLGYSSSIALSIHDIGLYTTYPQDRNPYVARGSRALFGYSFLFTPMIPLFFAGEEFDASFRPLPTLSPDWYDGKHPGKGRMLYGNMLDWTELDQPQHHSMFEDVKRMLAIRKQERSLLAPVLGGNIAPKLAGVQYKSNITVPVPYIRWDRGAAILIVANRNKGEDAHLKLKIPLEPMGRSPNAAYKVTDLWNGGESKNFTEKELASFACTIKRDGTPSGGLGVFKIEWAH